MKGAEQAEFTIDGVRRGEELAEGTAAQNQIAVVGSDAIGRVGLAAAELLDAAQVAARWDGGLEPVREGDFIEIAHEPPRFASEASGSPASATPPSTTRVEPTT